MGDGFVGDDLLRGVDERQIEVDRGVGPQQVLLQPVGLLRAAAQQVASVGPFVELLGHRKEHLDRLHEVGFREPDVAERVDEAAFAALEQPTHGSERAEPLRAG